MSRELEAIRMGRVHKRRDYPVWQGVYFVGRKRKRLIGITKEEATSKVLEAMEREKQNPIAGTRDPRLKDYAAEWLESLHYLQPSTVANYSQMLRDHILRHQVEDGKQLGDKRLCDISVRDVGSLLDAKVKAGLAPDTVRIIKATLSALMTDAVSDGFLRVNVCRQLSFRKRRFSRGKVEVEIHPFTRDEFERFVEVAREAGTAGLLFIVMGKAGLRPSEAICLEVADFDGETLNISKCLPEHGKLRMGTKTGKSRRVDVSSDLASLLRSHIARLREEAFRKGETPTLLFPNKAGGYLDWNNISTRVFASICKKC